MYIMILLDTASCTWLLSDDSLVRFRKGLEKKCKGVVPFTFQTLYGEGLSLRKETVHIHIQD